jgi:2-iminobutanoate/2-iminopropanoate deaminase
MDLSVVQTEKAPAAIGPYSQGIRAGNWLFVSGQIPLDPATGQMVGEEFGAQTRQSLENLANVIQAGECELSDVVSVDVFLTDMSQFTVFNEIYEQFFSSHKPARAVVEVKGLPRGAKVEIKCTAFRLRK